VSRLDRYAGHPISDVFRRDGSAHAPDWRVGLPIDVAHAAVFLASDESSFVAGAVIVVDGGLTVQTPGSLLSLFDAYHAKSDKLS
jgi:NAD(P)-dependent dehydrogenase (short-subunit alcohol dehydrogenase family)